MGEARPGSCVFGGESKEEQGALRRWTGCLDNQRKAPTDEHYRLTLCSPGSFGAGLSPSARGWRRLPLAGGGGRASGGGVRSPKELAYVLTEDTVQRQVRYSSEPKPCSCAVVWGCLNCGRAGCWPRMLFLVLTLKKSVSAKVTAAYLMPICGS